MKKIKANNPRSAVAYCRYSSENQSEASIEAQQKEIQRYAESNGLFIMRWYIDRAQSGTSDNRKEFREMIDDSKAREFSKVLVYQLDRFARNKEDHVIYKIDLRKNGVKVISIMERFEDTAEGKMMESLVEMYSAYYSQDLARKTIRGMKLNASKGLNNGGAPPYGYKLVSRLDEKGNPMFHNKGHELRDLAIDADRAEAVKIMFNMTLNGKKRSDIIDKLNMLGYMRANGKPFQGTSIDCILRNEKYTGTYIYNANRKKCIEDPYLEKDIVRVENAVPQIISKEVFDSVQKLLKQRVHSPRISEENYLLTGKIFCGECGRTYIGMRQAKKYLYYKCGNQMSYKNGITQQHYCHNNAIRKEDVEKFVLKQVNRIILNDHIIDNMMEEYYFFEKQRSVNASLIDMLEKQIKDTDERIENIASAISEGRVNQILFDKLDKLEEEKKRLIANLETEKKETSHKFANKQELEQVYKKARITLEKGTIEERKTLLHNFINKIFVYKDHVEIYLNVIPFMLGGYLDFEINRDEIMTLANFNPKKKVIENEKGIYSSTEIGLDEKKERAEKLIGQTFNCYEPEEIVEGKLDIDKDKKEQLTDVVVRFPDQENISGQYLGWLPLLDSNQRPTG